MAETPLITGVAGIDIPRLTMACRQLLMGATEMPNTTIRNAAGRIENLIPFDAGNLRGEHIGALSGAIGTGRLPDEFAKALRDAKTTWTGNYVSGDGTVPAGAPVYVVYSYDTPIGWVTAGRERVIPAERYSVTTSKHQGILRRAWNVAK